ncbi:hypothetical protein [uncultured Chryseobacterium sp.]|uniref:hypothetical protein n=1 Tax=uncultured Chryseobacterium sp. TaxID=259322 RepID=UPI0025FAD25A|nr:hypothetical protein [uncultured Chryseobacterium sp.]
MDKEILIYNTPNSGEILTKIHHHSFKNVWKKNLKKNNQNLVWAIIFIIAGLIAVFSENHTFAGFFFGFSLACLTSYFSYKSQYNEYKKNFERQLNKEIINLNKNSKDVIWEFAPEYFRFRNYKYDFRFLWEGVTYFILDTNFLYIKVLPELCFILDKENIDEINFNKTIEYLKTKAQIEKP